jgi:hypothetical protein
MRESIDGRIEALDETGIQFFEVTGRARRLRAIAPRM